MNTEEFPLGKGLADMIVEAALEAAARQTGQDVHMLMATLRRGDATRADVIAAARLMERLIEGEPESHMVIAGPTTIAWSRSEQGPSARADAIELLGPEDLRDGVLPAEAPAAAGIQPAAADPPDTPDTPATPESADSADEEVSEALTGPQLAAVANNWCARHDIGLAVLCELAGEPPYRLRGIAKSAAPQEHYAPIFQETMDWYDGLPATQLRAIARDPKHPRRTRTD